jgi:predicted  nucleic acid-binding Zn-ribbon protein
MNDARSQLASLLAIQDLVLEILAARLVVEGAPGKIEEAEARFRERNAEYVATKERFETIEADRAARSADLTALEESRKHFQDSLMQVKNQREYAAVLKEIDAVKARIVENEDAILASMDDVEALKTDLDARAAHIETERAIVETERAEIEAAVANAEATIARATARRAELEATLPAALVSNVRRVEEGRRGVFLVRADREMCSACHVRVRPQVYQEIRQAARLHACGNCKRYLYYEPAFKSAPPAEAPSPTVGAANGG